MVPEDESFATQSTVIWILASMTCHVSHWVVPGMDSLQNEPSCVSLGGSMRSLASEKTVIWILPNMTLHVSLYLVPGNESFVTHSTMI